MSLVFKTTPRFNDFSRSTHRTQHIVILMVMIFFLNLLFLKFFWFIAFWRERKKRQGVAGVEREKHWSVVPRIYMFIGWFLYVPWPGIRLTTLMYLDDALTNPSTRPGPQLWFLTVKRYKTNSAKGTDWGAKPGGKQAQDSSVSQWSCRGCT